MPPVASAPSRPRLRRPAELPTTRTEPRGPEPRGTEPSLPRVERRWQLLMDDASVTVVSSGATVAEARLSEPDERVVVEFWVDPSGLPGDVTAQLVEHAFSRPAARPRRPLLVCVPMRDGLVFAHAQRFVADAAVRPAGVTCLIEGRVGTGVDDESGTRCPAS